MLNSEKLQFFDKSRPQFEPYGLAVEKWVPKIMPRPDRHNEMEINLLTEGSITYLINDKKITVSSKRLAVFWALFPHQIIRYDNNAPYYVCTIPFAQFMHWQLPSVFLNQVLKGEVVTAPGNKDYNYDKYLMDLWLQDISSGDSKHIETSTKEISARLHRFALDSMAVTSWDKKKGSGDELPLLDKVEKMVIFIARNYKKPIKNKDIGKAVGLHPDYANTIFKKSFNMTLNQYVLQQRILYTQRQLSISDDSITKIAYEAGFNSLSRFNAVFKEKCNCSPRIYRKWHLSEL